MSDTPEAEPTYVNYRYEKSNREDGRRCHHWYLVDQQGTEHLAVIGVETDTLDGHYAYTAMEPFTSRLRLSCGNQAGVYKYLDQWIQGVKEGASDIVDPSIERKAAAGRRRAGGNGPAPTKSGLGQAAGSSPVSHASTGLGKGKFAKAKQSAVAAYGTTTAPKQKTVGIVQQNQIKKARKIQEELKGEQEGLVTAHLARLRRAAAAELQGDAAAKQVTLSWLQGSLNEEEQEALQHWRSLLVMVLSLQQQQSAADGRDCAFLPQHQHNPQQQPEQQQQQEVQEVPVQQPQQPLQPQSQQQLERKRKRSNDNGFESIGALPQQLQAWLQQPSNSRHHLRVVVECLRELGAADIPARLLLQFKLVALVQRCRAVFPHEAVRSLAEVIINRWKWQLAGHMQVLTQPVYMEDHVGILEEEAAAGLVPLPQLPKYKQDIVNVQLPSLPTGPGGSRSGYTPTPTSSYHTHSQYSQHHQQQSGLQNQQQHQQQQEQQQQQQLMQQQQHLLLQQEQLLQSQQQAVGTPDMYDAAAAAAVAGFSAYPPYLADNMHPAFNAAGFVSMTPGTADMYTPMPTLPGLQMGSSPAMAAAGAPLTAGLPAAPQQQLLLLGGGGGTATNPLQLQQLLAGQQMLPTNLNMPVSAGVGGLYMPGSNGLVQDWQLQLPMHAGVAASSSSYMCAPALQPAHASMAAGMALPGDQLAALLALQQHQQ